MARGFELGLDPANGGSMHELIFDLNDYGQFDASDNVSNALADDMIVTGISFDHALTDSAFMSITA
jgi:hypothetical protein